MANKKLTDLTELTTPADGDFLYIVDVSDTTESAQGTSKKIRKSNITPIISGKEDIANKQNSLAIDGTGTKYPTVDAVNDVINWKKIGGDINNTNIGKIGISTTSIDSSVDILKIGDKNSSDSKNIVAIAKDYNIIIGSNNGLNIEIKGTGTSDSSNRAVRALKSVAYIDPNGFNFTDAGGGAIGVEGVSRIVGNGSVDVATGGYFRVLMDLNSTTSLLNTAIGVGVIQHSGALLSPIKYAVGGAFSEQGGTTRSLNSANLVLGTSAFNLKMEGVFSGNWNVFSPSVFKNYWEGTQLVGTTTDNGVDKVQINGTVSASPATLTTQLPTLGQVIRNIIRDAIPSTVITGTLTETILKSYLIPANSFASSDIMNIPAISISKTGVVAGATFKIYKNTSNTLTGATQIAMYTVVNTARETKIDRHFLINSGNLYGYPSTSSFITDVATSGNPLTSTSFDVTTGNYIITTVTLLSTADSIIQTSFQMTN